ncbi:MAG: M3 family metallopeptidase [Geodermatophilaceae bacterium]|nr:M3 family metallopeptidase [Geodermatophilaceae bacterium]
MSLPCAPATVARSATDRPTLAVFAITATRCQGGAVLSTDPGQGAVPASPGRSDPYPSQGAVPASPGRSTGNPFARPSALPYALPPFDLIGEEHYLPAFDAGMAEQLAEVDAIAETPEEPTLDNTIVALERSGRLLDRVTTVFWNVVLSDSTDGLRTIEATIAPRLAAHSDAIHLHAGLFSRIEDLYARRENLDLSAEQLRLLERYRSDFLRAGSLLSEPDQDRLRQLNEELSRLSTEFSTRQLDENNDLAVPVEDRAQLDGMSQDAIASAEESARARGHDSGYLLPLGRPTAQPALSMLKNRALRERIFRAAMSRGLRGNEHDTRAILTRMVSLRAERAGLLGYPDHASYIIEDQTAGSVDAVAAMLDGLVAPAVANARAEEAVLQAAFEADGGVGPLQPWDWAYYAEHVKRARFEMDAAAVRPYFELERVLVDGIFHAASQLYGLNFVERHDLPTYHPDVRAFEVTDSDGAALGLFLGDFYARESKRGGAWMNNLVDQNQLLGTAPVVVNNLNIPQPPSGEPTLLTMDEVRTAFHEFGHALHGLFSDVGYPYFSGTNVPRDFVEYPSQVNEMWAWWPSVLANYAVHHQTGESMPPELIDRLLASRSYGEGFATTEYLAAALLDQEWHRRSPADPPIAPEDVESFESEALTRHGLQLDSVPPRYRSGYFSHIFSDDRYSAGYYSYIWSEVLDADTVEWFHQNGGLRRTNGDVFRAALLSRGGSVDPMEAFAAFRGRSPQIEPLLQRRGLLPGPASA